MAIPSVPHASVPRFPFKQQCRDRLGKQLGHSCLIYFLQLTPVKVCKEKQLVSEARKISFLCTRSVCFAVRYSQVYSSHLY